MAKYKTIKNTSSGKAKTLNRKMIRNTKALEARLADRSLSRMVEVRS